MGFIAYVVIMGFIAVARAPATTLQWNPLAVSQAEPSRAYSEREKGEMSHRHNAQDLVDRGFNPGSIVRIKMKNFLTYDECEIFPGPKLNVVLGPNGTGKSALTHAICLACVGSTGDVGRSNDLSKFVKRGAEGQEAYTEVDILDEDSNVQTIRRIINSENRGSKWTLNARTAKQVEVKTLVK
ncbi:hypothetical protein B484DRAFT_402263, partial [Ochromonadaceae sp. CCMP2298]